MGLHTLRTPALAVAALLAVSWQAAPARAASQAPAAQTLSVPAAQCAEREPDSRVVELHALRRSHVLTCVLANNVVVHLRRPPTSPAQTPPSPVGKGQRAGATLHDQSESEPQVTLTVAFNGAELLEDPSNRGVSLFAAAWLDSDDFDLDARAPEPRDARGAPRPPVSVNAAALQDALLIRIAGTPAQVEASLDWLVTRLELVSQSHGAEAALEGGCPPGVAAAARAVSTGPISPLWVRTQRERLEKTLASPRATRAATMSDAILHAICQDSDARLCPPSAHALNAITPELVSAWLYQHVRGGPGAPAELQRGGASIEGAIVGDVDTPTALGLIARTLGRLPARALPSPSHTPEGAALRRLGLRERFEHTQAPPPAAPPATAGAAATGQPREPGGPNTACLVLAGFSGTDISHTPEHRTLRALSTVLTRRADAALARRALSVANPEDPSASGVVSTGFSATPALAYPEIGLVMATVSVSPERAEDARAALLGAIEDLAQHPPTLEEVAQATATLARQAEDFEHDDRAWSVLLARSRSRGLDPETLAGGAAFYRALTSTDLAAAMQRFAPPERRFSVRLCPAP